MTVLLATLGQRPEAITMALDRLLPRYNYTELGILHTDPVHSGIADSLAKLIQVLGQEYGDIAAQYHLIGYPDGRALIDISDQASAEAYYHGLLVILRDYRMHYTPLHLLVSGGRKAMSIYAALAASLLFGEHDRVWTVHTPPELMEPGRFHAPVGMRDRVQVIQLPVVPSRLLPGSMADESVDRLIQRTQTSPRQHFLALLTEEEKRLVDLLSQHPYAENVDLADMLGKATKTIENQLRSIYQKLSTSFDLPFDYRHKRKMLLDVLNGRV